MPVHSLVPLGGKERVGALSLDRPGLKSRFYLLLQQGFGVSHPTTLKQGKRVWENAWVSFFRCYENIPWLSQFTFSTFLPVTIPTLDCRVKKKLTPGWKMAWWLKCLLCNYENLSLDTWYPYKKAGRGNVNTSIIQVLRGGDRKIPRVYWQPIQPISGLQV